MKPMLMLLILLTLLGILSATAQAQPFVEIGAGYNRNLTGCSECWDDAGANIFGAYFRVGYEKPVSENLLLGAHLLHLSQYFEGRPFNGNAESSLDHVGVYLRYNF